MQNQRDLNTQKYKLHVKNTKTNLTLTRHKFNNCSHLCAQRCAHVHNAARSSSDSISPLARVFPEKHRRTHLSLIDGVAVKNFMVNISVRISVWG